MGRSILVENSIPVILDDIKNYEDFDMSRCTYFTIESDVPLPNWVLELGNLRIPFYLLGISGIILQPIGNDNIFKSSDLIDKLFDTIESVPGLYIDTNDIWLPNFLFANLPHKRGSVYRIKEKLFLETYRYRYDKISEKRFYMLCEELSASIDYSHIETNAFKEWEKGKIEEAIRLYPKNRESELKWSQMNNHTDNED